MLAPLLRRRLDDLASDFNWETLPASSSTPDALTEEADAAMRRSHFYLVPAGERPSSATMWHAMRRGCIPVLFATCPRSVSLVGYADSVGIPNDEPLELGVPGNYSILLSQSEALNNRGS